MPSALRCHSCNIAFCLICNCYPLFLFLSLTHIHTEREKGRERDAFIPSIDHCNYITVVAAVCSFFLSSVCVSVTYVSSNNRFFVLNISNAVATLYVFRMMLSINYRINCTRAWAYCIEIHCNVSYFLRCKTKPTLQCECLPSEFLNIYHFISSHFSSRFYAFFSTLWSI